MTTKPDPQEFRRLMSEIIDAQIRLNDMVSSLAQCLRAAGYFESMADEAEALDVAATAQALYDTAKALVAHEQRASIALLQRHLGVNYQDAKTLLERLEQDGVVGAPEAAGGRRTVLVSRDTVPVPTMHSTALGSAELFSDDVDADELYEEAKRLVIEAGKASTSFLQRSLRIGYSRAARLIDLLEENGIIGPSDDGNPREVFGQS